MKCALVYHKCGVNLVMPASNLSQWWIAFLQIQLQYVVLGLRLNVINLNILPESKRYELKCSLKIAFMFLSIILKFQVLDIHILLGIRKKAKVFDGSWSANLVLGPRLMKGTRKVRKNAIVFQQKRNFHSISCIFFILDTVDYSFVASFWVLNANLLFFSNNSLQHKL